MTGDHIADKDVDMTSQAMMASIINTEKVPIFVLNSKWFMFFDIKNMKE